MWKGVKVMDRSEEWEVGSGKKITLHYPLDFNPAEIPIPPLQPGSNRKRAKGKSEFHTIVLKKWVWVNAKEEVVFPWSQSVDTFPMNRAAIVRLRENQRNLRLRLWLIKPKNGNLSTDFPWSQQTVLRYWHYRLWQLQSQTASLNMGCHSFRN